MNARSLFGALFASLFLLNCALAQRQMEGLSRGLIAVNNGGGKVFLSWRLLGNDPDTINFNVYRASAEPGAQAKRLNEKPISDSTNFVDATAPLTGTLHYTVRALVDGKELAPSEPFALDAAAPARQYFNLPLQTPRGYTPNDGSVGDLDGDGNYDLVIHMTGRGHDNSQRGDTDAPILQAYTFAGKLLWTINLGLNIREGAHYTQFMVYDFDGDGKAEVVCKTADGTIDGTGKVIGDAKADWRNDAGYILAGPEFLTVFDGMTGKALSTVPYLPPRHPTKQNPTPDELKEIWGDGYGNRCDRFLAGVAYLDGVHPSVIMCRGYYTRTVLAAWDFRDGKLSNRWVFDSAKPGHQKYAGQGHHQLSVADVDGDGKDEIIYGDMCINADGTGRYSTGCGHGDTLHVSDLDPTRPGMEAFSIQERFDDAGAHMFDASTGQIIWKKPSIKAAETGGDKGEGPGRGVCFDVDPRYPGAESWARGAGVTGMWDAKGNLICDHSPDSCNFAVWWDDDLLRELLDRNRIGKWNWKSLATDTLLQASDCMSCNGTKSTPVLSADLFGDWREEIIWRTSDNQNLRIYTTNIPTTHRITTLMHDPQYREAIAWQNVAYNQPPHPSFYIGPDMKTPAKPNITIRSIKSTTAEAR